MVGSDMEPTDARKAYPCFDEPAMKFRYTTTLVHEPIHVALSNMDQAVSVLAFSFVSIFLNVLMYSRILLSIFNLTSHVNNVEEEVIFNAKQQEKN